MISLFVFLNFVKRTRERVCLKEHKEQFIEQMSESCEEDCKESCSLAKAMKSKDQVVEDLEIPDSRLTKRWLERAKIGVMDKRYWPEEKNEYNCAKKLSEKVPEKVLPGCGFHNRGTSAEKITRICNGMTDVLKWAYQGCKVPGNGNARAMRTLEKFTQLCENMKRKYPKPIKPDPSSETCPYDEKNKICDDSDKCGLSYISSCVQSEVFLKI